MRKHFQRLTEALDLTQRLGGYIFPFCLQINMIQRRIQFVQSEASLIYEFVILKLELKANLSNRELRNKLKDKSTPILNT